MDATRLSDGEQIVFRIANWLDGCFDTDVAFHFSSEPVRSDPRNCCVPILDALLAPPFRGDRNPFCLLVMPKLHSIAWPPFETVDQVVTMQFRVLQVRVFS